MAGTLRNLGLILAWPAAALRRALPQVRKKGPAVRAALGKGLVRQLGEILYLAIRFHVPPIYYYRFELYDPERQGMAPDYLMRYEMSDIAYRFLRSVDHSPKRSLKNKLEFVRACADAGLPHVPILMAFVGGRRLEDPNFAAELPDRDLFVKRNIGKGGVGAELWRLTAPGQFASADGKKLTRDGLLAHVAKLSLSRRGPFLIQPATVNCAELRDLSSGALCTARLVSIRNEAGGHEVTNASFRMAVDPASSVDNFHAGGIAAPIDIATGRLGKASDLGISPGLAVWHSRHPRTGGQIEGRILPMWAACIALAVRAHATFRDWIVVGWDVAILENGLCLIEGNQGPDVDLIQRPLRRPIGNERFGELLAMHMERIWDLTQAPDCEAEARHSAAAARNP